uniref:hypothetical protein n=1 Tax=Aliarcobacter sp. TaxID=2321116 RepID=UPI004047EF06
MSKDEDLKIFLEKHTFTTCDECIHKVNKTYQNDCLECRHYYPSMFEKRIEKDNNDLPNSSN